MQQPDRADQRRLCRLGVDPREGRSASRDLATLHDHLLSLVMSSQRSAPRWMSRLHPTGSSWQHRKIMASQTTEQGCSKSRIRRQIQMRGVGGLETYRRGEISAPMVPDPLRRRSAWTMAVDTLRALTAVLPVIVISNQPELAARLSREQISARVLAEPVVAGMNAALRHGEKAAAMAGFSSTLACVGDLPALRPDSIRAVLAAAINAGGHSSQMPPVRGRRCSSPADTELEPHFQGRSAAGHRESEPSH